MHGDIRKCPRCVQPVVRRLDGSRITGFLPESLYVGYLVVAKHFGVRRPPVDCPECSTVLVTRRA